MRRSAREAVATTVNDLTDALDADGYDEDERREILAGARERLSLLLDRDEIEREVRDVEHTRRGGRVKVKMTRGDSVREMDEWTVQGEGPTAEDAAAEFEANLRRYEEEWADRVRDLDPYGGGG